MVQKFVLECLKEQGVDTVFGYPGGAILNIYDELYKQSDQALYKAKHQGKINIVYKRLHPKQ